MPGSQALNLVPGSTAALATSYAIAATTVGLEPDWDAVLRYGGVAVMVGVVGAMWSPKSRHPLIFMRLILTAFVIGGGLGAAFAEWQAKPTMALGVTILVSFFLPSLMTDWKGTITALLSIWRSVGRGGHDSK